MNAGDGIDIWSDEVLGGEERKLLVALWEQLTSVGVAKLRLLFEHSYSEEWRQQLPIIIRKLASFEVGLDTTTRSWSWTENGLSFSRHQPATFWAKPTLECVALLG